MVEEEATAAFGRVPGEGGDKGGGHEAVHEVELLGAGDAGTAGETQGEGIARDGPRRPLHRHRRLPVQLP